LFGLNMKYESDIDLIKLMLYKINPHPIVYEIISVAYAVGYDEFSDGITFMHELNFRGMKMKHPLGVGHDLLYALGVHSPWLPVGCSTNYKAREWADLWFRRGMLDFGHWARAYPWWSGLRVGAWYGWNCHRRTNNPQKELLASVLLEYKKIRVLDGMA